MSETDKNFPLDGIISVCNAKPYGSKPDVTQEAPNATITKEWFESIQATLQKSEQEFNNMIAAELWKNDPPVWVRTPEEEAQSQKIRDDFDREFNRWPNRLRRFRASLWYRITRPLHKLGPCECDCPDNEDY